MDAESPSLGSALRSEVSPSLFLRGGASVHIVGGRSLVPSALALPRLDEAPVTLEGRALELLRVAVPLVRRRQCSLTRMALNGLSQRRWEKNGGVSSLLRMS